MTNPPSRHEGSVRRRVGSRIILVGIGIAVLSLLDSREVTTARDVTLIMAAVAGNVFILGYAILAPWFRSAVGRNIMGMMASTAALLDLNLAALVLGREYALRPYAGAFIYCSLLFFILGRLRMVWRAQVTVPRAEKKAAMLRALTAGARHHPKLKEQ